MVKGTKNSEAGILPGDPRAPSGFDELFERMGRFNEELVKAGVLLAGDGLQPSSKGKRVRFSGSGGDRPRRVSHAKDHSPSEREVARRERMKREG